MYFLDEERYWNYLFAMGFILSIFVVFSLYSYFARRFKEHEEKTKAKKKELAGKESKKKK